MTDATERSGGLRKLIVTSVKLSSLQFASSIALRLVSTVVLTRLLAPEIYGVFAVVLLYRYLLEMFSDLGLRAIVLTKEGPADETFLRTCWSVSVLRGGVILLLSIVIGLAVALLQRFGLFPADSAYVAPALPWAIAALGGTALVSGLHSMNRFAYEREMKFGHVTISAILSNLVGLIATILLAWWLRSVWALVIGAYVQTAVLTIYSFMLFTGPSMRWVLDPPSVKIIMDRGKWIIGHSTLTALSQAADRMVLGLVMSSSMFGYYFIARQIVDIGLTFLDTVHSQIGLQVFTRIVGVEQTEFQSKYYRYRLFFDGLAGFGAGAMFVLAQALIDLVFDDRYADVGPMVSLLVFALLPIGALVLREAYSAERKFRQMTILSLVSTVTLWVGLLLAVWAGNVQAALLVIALHRVPEVVILWWMGAGRGWLVPWRETLVFAFFGVGAAAGWAVLQVWNMVA